MKKTKRNPAKSVLAFLLALPLVLPGSLPVQAETGYTHSPTELMYLKGLEATYQNADKSYSLYDIDQDDTCELFIGTRGGSSDTLEIWVYDQGKKSPVLKKTIKKAVRVYEDTLHSMIIVETKAAPSNTFTSYKLTGPGKLKAKTTYRAEKGGKYYKNKKEISGTKYRSYKKKLTKKHGQLHFTAAESPWVDSSIPGVAGITGEPDLKDDFRFASMYSWLSEQHLTDGQSSTGTLVTLNSKIKEKKEALFSDRDTYTGENVDIIRTYYDRATDWEARDKDRVDPLRKYIDDIQNVKSLSELSELYVSDEFCAVVRPVIVGIAYDSEDMSHYLGYVRPGSLSMNPYDYLDAEGDAAALADYRWDFDTKVTYSLSRAGYPRAMINKILQDCHALEDTLFQAYRTEELVDGPVVFSDLVSRFKRFPMDRLMDSFGITEGRFLIDFPTVLTALDELYTESNLEKLKAVYCAQAAINCLPYLDYEALAISQNLLTYNGEVIEEEETGEAAYTKDEIREELEELAMKDAVEGLTSVAYENAYMEYFVDPELKADLTGLCEEYRTAFSERIEKLDWLSATSKKAAQEKLAAMNFFVMSADELIDASYVKMDPDASYLDSCLKVIRSYYRHRYSFIGKPIDRERWSYDIDGSSGTALANSYYTPLKNTFVIMAGIIDEDTYRLDMPKEEKLGIIGMVIGHEITHGFDSTGVQYGKDGNFVATDEKPWGWFTETDYNTFLSKVSRVADFFDQIWPIPEAHCLGEYLAGEVIGDMGGVALGLEIAEKTEGFDFDKYFRAYSILWKAQNTYEREKFTIFYDVHPLKHLRINVTLQQFDRFYKTYGIKEGDGMYLAPENRLNIW